MPTKISDLTAYDGDQLDGPEVLPLVETDEGQTEKITVAQLFGNAPAITTEGTLTVRQPGGTAGTDELTISDTTIETHGSALSLLATSSNGLIINGITNKVSYGNINQIGDINGSNSPKRILLRESINDGNNNELIGLTPNASAVNHLEVANAPSGSAPTLRAVGGDSNVDLFLTPKGNGDVKLPGGGYLRWRNERDSCYVRSKDDFLRLSSKNDILFRTRGSESARLKDNDVLNIGTTTTQPGTSTTPILQMGTNGAGFFINSSGEIVAVDEAGNTTVIS